MKQTVLVLCLLLLLVGCGTSTISQIDNPVKPMAEMSEADLIQMVEYYHQKMETDKRTIGTITFAVSAIVYQNELILRALIKQEDKMGGWPK